MLTFSKMKVTYIRILISLVIVLVNMEPDIFTFRFGCVNSGRYIEKGETL